MKKIVTFLTAICMIFMATLVNVEAVSKNLSKNYTIKGQVNGGIDYSFTATASISYTWETGIINTSSISFSNIAAESVHPFIGYGVKVEPKVTSIDASNDYTTIFTITVTGYAKTANNTWTHVGTSIKYVTINSPGPSKLIVG